MKTRVGVDVVTTVINPEGTITPAPRQYYRVEGLPGRLAQQDADGLFEVLRQISKHVSNVVPCPSTPSGDPTTFYVSYGLCCVSPSTRERIGRYAGDITRAISDWFNPRH